MFCTYHRQVVNPHLIENFFLLSCGCYYCRIHNFYCRPFLTGISRFHPCGCFISPAFQDSAYAQSMLPSYTHPTPAFEYRSVSAGVTPATFPMPFDTPTAVSISSAPLSINSQPFTTETGPSALAFSPPLPSPDFCQVCHQPCSIKEGNWYNVCRTCQGLK